MKVPLTLLPDDLKFYNSNLEFVAEPVEFLVYVGTNANAALSSSFRLKQ